MNVTPIRPPSPEAPSRPWRSLGIQLLLGVTLVLVEVALTFVVYHFFP